MLLCSLYRFQARRGPRTTRRGARRACWPAGTCAATRATTRGRSSAATAARRCPRWRAPIARRPTAARLAGACWRWRSAAWTARPAASWSARSTLRWAACRSCTRWTCTTTACRRAARPVRPHAPPGPGARAPLPAAKRCGRPHTLSGQPDSRAPSLQGRARVLPGAGPCRAQGALPDALGNLTALSQLVLRGNALTGQLPAWLPALPALRAAWLGDNNFSGPVPAAWCGGGGIANISLQARLRAACRAPPFPIPCLPRELAALQAPCTAATARRAGGGRRSARAAQCSCSAPRRDARRPSRALACWAGAWGRCSAAQDAGAKDLLRWVEALSSPVPKNGKAVAVRPPGARALLAGVRKQAHCVRPPPMTRLRAARRAEQPAAVRAGAGLPAGPRAGAGRHRADGPAQRLRQPARRLLRRRAAVLPRGRRLRARPRALAAALSLPARSAAAAPVLAALRPGREAGRGGRESAGMPRSAGKGPWCLWRKPGVRRPPSVHQRSKRGHPAARARVGALGLERDARRRRPGARVLVPPFWTNISLFPFNFTAFDAPGAAIQGYDWGIGSEPATDNVVGLGVFSGTVQARPLPYPMPTPRARCAAPAPAHPGGGARASVPAATLCVPAAQPSSHGGCRACVGRCRHALHAAVQRETPSHDAAALGLRCAGRRSGPAAAASARARRLRRAGGRGGSAGRPRVGQPHAVQPGVPAAAPVAAQRADVLRDRAGHQPHRLAPHRQRYQRRRQGAPAPRPAEQGRPLDRAGTQSSPAACGRAPCPAARPSWAIAPGALHARRSRSAAVIRVG